MNSLHDEDGYPIIDLINTKRLPIEDFAKNSLVQLMSHHKHTANLDSFKCHEVHIETHTYAEYLCYCKYECDGYMLILVTDNKEGEEVVSTWKSLFQTCNRLTVMR